MLIDHGRDNQARKRILEFIEELLDLMQKEPLDPSFERFGNFVIANPGDARENPDYPAKTAVRWLDEQPVYPDNPKVVRFFGNFRYYSRVFRLDTDEPELIEKLTQAIHANQASAGYREARDRMAAKLREPVPGRRYVVRAA